MPEDINLALFLSCACCKNAVEVEVLMECLCSHALVSSLVVGGSTLFRTAKNVEMFC
jgi:hypothetical protein